MGKKNKKPFQKEQNSLVAFAGLADLMGQDGYGVDDFSKDTDLDTESSPKTNSKNKKRKPLTPNQQMMWSGHLTLPVVIPVKYSLQENVAPRKKAKIICDKDLNKNSVEVIKDFVKFCDKYLDISNFPTINLYSVKKPNMTTGAYDMNTNTISCLVGRRLIVDVLRTLAHELAHRKQHERGDLNVQLAEIDPMDEMGDIDTAFENEAYTLAGNLVKIYCRKQKVLSKDELYALNENKNISERSKKFSKPIEVYHGTTDKFLNSILSSGLVPNPSVGPWRGKYTDGSEAHSSLASLEGTYLTRRVSTAMSYAYDANRKAAQGYGLPIVIQAEIVPQAAFADEDNINIDGIASKAIHETLGRNWNPWLVRGIKDAVPDLYVEMQNTFAKLFHEKYSRGPKQPLNTLLLHDTFDAAVERRLPYAAQSVSSWDAASSYFMAIERYGSSEAAKKRKEELGSHKVPDDYFSEVEAEKNYKAAQEKITRAYRFAVDSLSGADEYSSLRLNYPIKLTGRNKITGIVSLPTNDDNRVIRILYGNPSDNLIKGIRQFASVDYPVVRGYQSAPPNKDSEKPAGIQEKNVLDKMGAVKATDKIRRNSVSGPVYLDKHDPNKKQSKDVVKKVAKNLNRKPYSHHPPMMGLK